MEDSRSTIENRQGYLYKTKININSLEKDKRLHKLQVIILAVAVGLTANSGLNTVDRMILDRNEAKVEKSLSDIGSYNIVPTIIGTNILRSDINGYLKLNDSTYIVRDESIIRKEMLILSNDVAKTLKLKPKDVFSAYYLTYLKSHNSLSYKRSESIKQDMTNIGKKIIHQRELQLQSNFVSKTKFSGYELSKLDLRMKCGLNEKQLNEIIAWKTRYHTGSLLRGNAKYFLEAEKSFNVNAVFLLSLATLEGGCGDSGIARSKFNFFGWHAFESDNCESAASFKSVEDGILSVSQKISEEYTNSNNTRQYTVQRMKDGSERNPGSHCYNSRQKWVEDVSQIMAEYYNYIANKEGKVTLQKSKIDYNLINQSVLGYNQKQLKTCSNLYDKWTKEINN